MHSLYIRPTSICMDNRLSMSKVEKMKTFVILSPVGPYYPRGFVPVKLYCDTEAVRAWPRAPFPNIQYPMAQFEHENRAEEDRCLK